MSRSIVVLTACGLALTATLFAQSNPIYVQFSPGSVKAALQQAPKILQSIRVNRAINVLHGMIYNLVGVLTCQPFIR